LNVGKQVYGFPPTLLTRLRYCDTVSMASTSGSIAKYLFRVNDIFDPDYTGSGHQPLYRDTFAAIYDFYTVKSARVTLTITNGGNIPAPCGVLLDDDTTVSTSASVLMEQNTGKHHLLPAQSGSISSHTFHLDFDAKKFYGWDVMTAYGSKTLVANTPSIPAYFVSWAQPADLASTVTYYITIEIIRKCISLI
jgi:hypothetical protein